MIGESRTLTLQDPESGLTFAVAFDRWDMERPQWHYRVSGPAGEIFAEGTDLRGGCASVPCESRALADLLGFIGAYAEAIEYERRTGSESDNRGLFPDSLADVAYQVGSDGFAILAESVELER